MRHVSDVPAAPPPEATIPKSPSWRERLTLANNVWGLPIGVGGIVIGSLLSWIFWELSLVELDPTMIVDPQRTVVIERARLKDAPMRVVRTDGQPVEQDVTGIRVYFWNDGRKPLLPAEVIEPYVLSIDAPAEILDFKVLKASRPSVTQVAARRVDGTNNRVAVDFRVLEREQGLSLQLMIAGSPDVKVSMAGAAIGAQVVTDADSASSKHLLVRLIGAPGPRSLVLFVTLLLGTAGYYLGQRAERQTRSLRSARLGNQAANAIRSKLADDPDDLAHNEHFQAAARAYHMALLELRAGERILRLASDRGRSNLILGVCLGLLLALFSLWIPRLTNVQHWTMDLVPADLRDDRESQGYR
jgi:hypothetical protein